LQHQAHIIESAAKAETPKATARLEAPASAKAAVLVFLPAVVSMDQILMVSPTS